jgi:hypothetical protein
MANTVENGNSNGNGRRDYKRDVDEAT